MEKKPDKQQRQHVKEEATLHEEFSIAEAAAITGVASNHIQQWMDLGWVKPSIQPASGEKTRPAGFRRPRTSVSITRTCLMKAEPSLATVAELPISEKIKISPTTVTRRLDNTTFPSWLLCLLGIGRTSYIVLRMSGALPVGSRSSMLMSD